MTLGKRLSGHTGRNVRSRMRRAWHSGWHGAAFANRRHFLSNKQKTKKHEPVGFNIKLSCKVRIKRMSLFSPPEHRGRARLRQGNQRTTPACQELKRPREGAQRSSQKQPCGCPAQTAPPHPGRLPRGNASRRPTARPAPTPLPPPVLTPPLSASPHNTRNGLSHTTA